MKILTDNAESFNFEQLGESRSISRVETNNLSITLRKKVEDYILSCQQDNGAILWFKNGKLDPWDHCEAAMALSINHNFSGFRLAFNWLVENQNDNGSWFAKYFANENDGDLDRHKVETNFVAYPACALWHYFLISSDRSYLQEAFPYIEKSINFVLKHQNEEGDIQWAISEKETLPHDSLVTANASILRSLECAIYIAKELSSDSNLTAEKSNVEHWKLSYKKLADCLANKPWRFDRTWESKARFSMDWFYPILSGVYKEEEAQKRIDQRWDEFVHPDFGCRCVSDEPWVTIAESCELCLALIASGRKKEASRIFNQLLQWQDEDGGFWTGYSFRDKVIWPKEKTTWTAAAILLVLDALENLTPASTLFTTPSSILFSAK